MHIPYNDRVRILSVDPSSTHIGVAIVEVDLKNGNINIPFAITICRKDLLRHRQWMIPIHGARHTAVHEAASVFAGLIREWEPHAVIIEAPYLSKFAEPFKALSEIVMTIHNVVMDWDCTVPVYQIEASTVKAAMGVSGKSGDKDLMRQALQVTQLPVNYTGVNINDLDEHAIDAISVGLWYIRSSVYVYA